MDKHNSSAKFELTKFKLARVWHPFTTGNNDWTDCAGRPLGTVRNGRKGWHRDSHNVFLCPGSTQIRRHQNTHTPTHTHTHTRHTQTYAYTHIDTTGLSKTRTYTDTHVCASHSRCFCVSVTLIGIMPTKKLTRIADSPVSRPLVEATIRFQRLQVADISWNRRTGHQALSCQTTICVVIAPPVAICMRGNIICTRTARTHCSAHACASEAVHYRVSHVARTCARRAQQAACGVVSRHGDVVACRRCTSMV